MNKRKCAKPIRMWIDGKSYNLKKLDKPKFFEKQNVPKERQQKERLFSTKFYLPVIYYTNLDKYRYPQIEAVESETNTVITYPKNGKEGILEISGDSDESIEEAREQIHSIIAYVRQQFSALQFISIPLLSEEVKNNFEQFKNTILSEKHQGVDESIFQSPLKLHLTVVVFTLFDEREKLEALNTLQECKNLFKKNAHSSSPMKIKIQGLNCMNDNFSKVNVLYANTCLSDDSESEKSLQEIVNAISEIYYEKGLVREYQDSVKLHMTLMNTKYRKNGEHSPKKRWVKREPFNATAIMEKHKDYYFGEAVFDTIHLSLISSKGEDGFYKSLGSIKIFE